MPTKRAGPPPGLVPAEPPTRSSYDWYAIAEWVKAHPMEWFMVFESDRHSRAVSVQAGDNAALLPEQGFEAITANTNHKMMRGRGGIEKRTRVCSLYVRYNPENDTTRSNGKATT